MLFPTHLLVGALLGRVSPVSTTGLVFGAAIPDVVDKPLALVGTVDLYHSIGHSILLVAVFVPIALYSTAGFAVAVGWGSHLTLDALHVVVNGRPADLLSLFWPIVAPPDPLLIPPGSFVTFYVGSNSFFLEAGLWLLVGIVVFATWRSNSLFIRN